MSAVVPSFSAAGLDEEYVLETCERLVSLPSVSGEERAVSEWTAGELRRLGLDVVEQEVTRGRNNVIGTLEGMQRGPTLLFNGHLDTLPIPTGGTHDPYRPRRVDGRLHGAEINNMKAAVAAMIASVAILARERASLSGRVVLSAVVGECDALGLGTLHMLEAGLSADAAINGEPTDLNVMTSHAGVTQLQLRVTGHGVHICQRDDGCNAIDGLVGLLSALDEKALCFSRHADFPGLPTLNVGVIRGGRMASVLADDAEALIDVRTVPGMTPESVCEDISRFAAAHLDAEKGFRHRVELLARPTFCQQHPYHVRPDAGIVRLVADSHVMIHGRPPHVGSMYPQVFFGTDASHLLHAGIPTVIYGPGRVEDINSVDESIEISHILDAARVYLASARRFCSVS